MPSQPPGDASSTALSKAGAPSPDAPAKPDSPSDLNRPTWRYIASRAAREFQRDSCMDLAAGLTYFAVLALFPALLALVAMLGFVGQAEATTDFLIRGLEAFASEEVVELLRQPIGQLASSTGAGLAFAVGLGGALWTASGYVNAFGRAMNRIYQVDEGRPVWKLRPQMLVLTLLVLVLAALAVALLVLSGPVAEKVGNLLGVGAATLAAWNIAKWPGLVLVAIAIVALLYHFTPNVRQPKFRWLSLGAAGALLVLALATAGFFFYVSNFGTYNRTYGSIGGVIVLLLWLWLGNMSLLLGAEFDAEMERGRQLQGGIKAEAELQLPPRDTRSSRKKQKRLERDIAAGRDLRGTSHRTGPDGS